MKKIFNILLIALISSNYSYAQLSSTEVLNEGGSPNSLSFFDGSSSTSYNSFNSAGKGLMFPRIDLTTLKTTDIFDGGSIGQANYNPNYYDGLVVYNTVSGSIVSTDPMGSILGDNFDLGFYYYQNVSGTLNGGQWLPLDGSFTKTITINTVPALGVSTVLDLDEDGAIVVGGGTIGEITNLLEAKIYDNTGQLVLTASSNYDNDTKELTTGNGGVNTLLSVGKGPYTVILAYK
jgi:hypothetical protein